MTKNEFHRLAPTGKFQSPNQIDTVCEFIIPEHSFVRQRHRLVGRIRITNIPSYIEFYRHRVCGALRHFSPWLPNVQRTKD